MKISLHNLSDGDRLPCQVVIIRGSISNYDPGISSNLYIGHARPAEPLPAASGGTPPPPLYYSSFRAKIFNGKFKALLRLFPGENELTLQYGKCSKSLSVYFDPRRGGKQGRLVKLVYIVCQDHDGRCQAPEGTSNDDSSALRRISLAGSLLQTFTAESLRLQGLDRRSFALEFADDAGDDIATPICHVFKSRLTLARARDMSGHELWAFHARELLESKLHDEGTKFVALLAATRYSNPTKEQPADFSSVLTMTKAHAALGAGGLALFGSGCLYTLPEELEDVQNKMMDPTPVDWRHFMDDSGYRGSLGGCFTSSLGGLLHELGHCFDLGHTEQGIMARGFDDLDKAFLLEDDDKRKKPSYPERPEKAIAFCQKKADAKDRSETIPIIRASTATMTSARVTTFKATSKGTELLSHYHEKQGLAQMRTELGGACWGRACALILSHHKWIFSKSGSSEIYLGEDGKHLISSTDIVVLDIRDAESNSIGHEEPRSKKPSIEHISKKFPQAVEICAVNEDGYLLKHLI